MQTINLSKLVLSPLFLHLLAEEGLNFDHIFTDSPLLAEEDNIKLITEQFFEFWEMKSWGSALLILDQLTSQNLPPSLVDQFSCTKIIVAQSGIGSLGRKLQPEYRYLNETTCQAFTPIFPFDLIGFLQTLKRQENQLILLNHQEIPENKYETSDEELQIIDEAMIKEPELLCLLTPENPELLLLGTGNHFEECIKLAQYLQENPEHIALLTLGKRTLLSSEPVQKLAKKAKKIWIILDHFPTDELQKILQKILGKPVCLLTPHYKKISSFFPEYQLEQAYFDAPALLSRSLELLKQA